MPDESVQLFEQVESGDIASARELWSRMIPSLLYIWRGNYMCDSWTSLQFSHLQIDLKILVLQPFFFGVVVIANLLPVRR
ncbi:MAG: hypothetical protein WD356_00160 [Pseudomonadales bacterium]